MDTHHDFQSIRSEICNWLCIAIIICSVPVLIVGLIRATAIGWHWIFFPQTALPILAIPLLVFRNSIRYSFRAGYIVLLFVAVGLFGMSRFGLLAAAIPTLIVAPNLAVILFGLRTGIYSLVLILSVASLIAVGKLSGFLESQFDAAAYVELGSSWVLFLLSMIICIVVSTTAIVKILRDLTSALALSGRNRAELEVLVLQRTEELENAKTEAENLARTDPLTGIKNRRAFFELAQLLDGQARRSRLVYAVLMIDIDYFKRVNDRWGHQIGDSVLAFVSELSVRVSRSSDIVARWGGEEFVVLLPDTNLENAKVLAEKLRREVENTPVQAPKGKIEITISVGVAVLDATTKSFDQVVSRADAALYQAKRNGRNRVCCYQVDKVDEFK